MDLSVENCMLCPRKCGVNRSNGELGFCRTHDGLYVARAALHNWEEPVISGASGSGAIFFTGCNLGCVFCQNSEISKLDNDASFSISEERLYEIFYELRDQGANNINLVTATHQMHRIIPVLKKIKREGFLLPIIYNSSGYEAPWLIDALDGLVDVYLPDFKYVTNELAKKYSACPDYKESATLAIKKMVEQTGPAVFTDEPAADDTYESSPLIKSGVIVRHLVLPNHYEESKAAIKYLYDTFGDDIFISIMSQYTPMPTLDSNKYPLISGKVDFEKYEEIVDYAISIGVENGFIQEEDVATESFIPSFNKEGVVKE